MTTEFSHVSEALEAGADRLEKNGWWGKGQPFDNRHRYCMMTSLPVCELNIFPLQYIMAAAYELLPDCPDRSVTFINDNVIESQQQAIDLMRYAAKLARQDEEKGSR
jgi:hypothetical protein